MGDVGEKVYRAEQAGEFYCGVCDEYVPLGDAEGFDETRQGILDHHNAEHP